MKLGFLGLISGDDIIQSNPGIIIRNPAFLDISGPPQWTSQKIKCLLVFLNLLKKKKKVTDTMVLYERLFPILQQD